MATKHLDYAGLAHVIAKLINRQFQNKGLSTEDFTTALKNKLAALPTTFVSQADVTALQSKVTALEKLIESDSDGAINKFNEIVSFLAGITDTKTLQGLLADISAQLGTTNSNVTNLTSRVSAVEQKAATNATNISKKADSTTVTALKDMVESNYAEQEGLRDDMDATMAEMANVVRTRDLVSITNAEIDALIAAGGAVS